MFTLAVLTLTGCDAVDKVKDKIDGFLNPVVALGIVLGVEPPESELLDGVLDGTQFKTGTTATLFIADATDVSDIENAPIEGATVRLIGPNVDAEMAELDSGSYAIDPTASQGIVYASGDTWAIRVERTDGDGGTSVSEASLILPPDADFSEQLPEQHTADTSVVLDFSAFDFESALVVVLNESREITYSNQPGTIRELYDFTRGNDPLTTLEIPASAFVADQIHAVGVAGMKYTDADDLTEMNTALSTVIYGKMNFYPVSTRPIPPLP